MPTPPAVNCAVAMPRGWRLVRELVVRELVGDLVGLFVARRGQCRLPPKVAKALHRASFPSADVGGRPRGGAANPSAAGPGGAEAGGEWQQRFANGSGPLTGVACGCWLHRWIDLGCDHAGRQTGEGVPLVWLAAATQARCLAREGIRGGPITPWPTAGRQQNNQGNTYQAGGNIQINFPPPAPQPDPKLQGGRRLHNLPPAIDGFVARDEQLNQLLEVLGSPGSQLVIHGTPGVGKTSLALHFAVSSANHFPGGGWWLEASEGFEPMALRACVELEARIDGLGSGDGLEPEARLRRCWQAWPGGDGDPEAVGG